MTNAVTIDASHDGRGGYKVDASRGERIGRVSSEWFNRPADERYLSLTDLMASVQGRAERSRTAPWTPPRSGWRPVATMPSA